MVSREHGMGIDLTAFAGQMTIAARMERRARRIEGMRRRSPYALAACVVLAQVLGAQASHEPPAGAVRPRAVLEGSDSYNAWLYECSTRTARIQRRSAITRIIDEYDRTLVTTRIGAHRPSQLCSRLPWKRPRDFSLSFRGRLFGDTDSTVKCVMPGQVRIWVWRQQGATIVEVGFGLTIRAADWRGQKFGDDADLFYDFSKCDSET